MDTELNQEITFWKMLNEVRLQKEQLEIDLMKAKKVLSVLRHAIVTTDDRGTYISYNQFSEIWGLLDSVLDKK